MSNMKMIVEVEKAEAGHPVEVVWISVDKEALESLVGRLARLHRQKTGDHIHLMSEEWGLGDLTAKPTVAGNHPVHHLLIRLIE